MKIRIDVFEQGLAEKCMTLKDLADASKINVATLTRIRREVQEPMPITVGKIAIGLGIPVEKLIKAE